MKRILSQCIKELAQFRRDRLTLALAFLLPITSLFIFGFAIRLEAKDIPLVVRDLDGILLKGVGLEALWGNAIVLGMGVSPVLCKTVPIPVP
ncbi:hypothetical protein [Altericista sp. CCNU0014]|uniref:hypothetical protein n=1 Tax=Altericista sp. CCNU0014 TaxID=3082949 RepID=UPI00384A51A8